MKRHKMKILIFIGLLLFTFGLPAWLFTKESIALGLLFYFLGIIASGVALGELRYQRNK